MRRALLFVAAGVGLALGAAACNPVQPYAALVNGQAITQTALNQELEAVRSSPELVQGLASSQPPLIVNGAGANTFGAQFTAQVLNSEILNELIHQEFQRRHLTLGPADMAAARQQAAAQFGTPAIFAAMPKEFQQKVVQEAAEAAAVSVSLSRVDLSPAGLARYYDAHRAEFVQACVQHILVPTQAEAAQVKADIAAGKPFDQEAAAKSTDTGSAQNGGRLGCGPPSRYVAPFAAAVETLPVGVVSDPVQSQFGWHIIEVTARTQEPLSAAAAQIRQQLVSSADQNMNGFLEQMAARARVEVNPRYGTWVGSSANGPSVQPPQPPNVRSDGPPTTAGAGTSGPAPIGP